MISPIANLFNKHSFLLLYNIQREATISTYTDGAKSMAKVRTDILNNDHVSSFKRPLIWKWKRQLNHQKRERHQEKGLVYNLNFVRKKNLLQKVI